MQELEANKEAVREMIVTIKKLPSSCCTLGDILDLARLEQANNVYGLSNSEFNTLTEILKKVRDKYVTMTNFYRNMKLGLHPEVPV